MADAIKRGVEIISRPKAQRALTEVTCGDDVCNERWVFEEERFSGLNFFRGLDYVRMDRDAGSALARE